MKAMNIRFSDEVAALLDQRQGELKDMSINTLANVAIRRLLAQETTQAVPADDTAVASALQRVMSRDKAILEALKNL